MDAVVVMVSLGSVEWREERTSSSRFAFSVVLEGLSSFASFAADGLLSLSDAQNA